MPIDLVVRKLRVHCKRASFLLTFCLSGLWLGAAAGAQAAESGTYDELQLSTDFYLWGIGLGGEAANGGDIDVSFSTLLDNLSFAFMGGMNARKGPWSFGLDVLYNDISADNDGRIPLPVGGHEGLSFATDSKLDLKNWIVTPLVGYRVVDTERGSFDLIAGARYLDIENKLRLTAEGPLSTRVFNVEATGSGWDGIVGFKGRLNLNPTWFIPAHFDIGAGDSDKTWRAFTGIGYARKNFDAILGYRYLFYKFESNPVLHELEYSGALLGIRWHWL